MGFDNVGSLGDPIDRKMDQNMAKTYIAEGLVLFPVVTLTLVSRPSRVWIEDLADDPKRGVSRTNLRKTKVGNLFFYRLDVHSGQKVWLQQCWLEKPFG